MKFLVITDLHQKKSALQWINDILAKRGIDTVLFLGDVTDFGTAQDAVDIVKGINAKTYVLPGNCDPRDLPEKISSVAVDMHGKSAEIGGLYVAGLGGSNITIFNTLFELTEEEIDAKLRPICRKGMLLMTHAPSYGTLDHIPNGMSVGSPAIAKIVEEFKPIVALSGHIHEDVGCFERDGTLFLNPGPAKEGRSAILTIENGKASAELLGPLDPA